MWPGIGFWSWTDAGGVPPVAVDPWFPDKKRKKKGRRAPGPPPPSTRRLVQDPMDYGPREEPPVAVVEAPPPTVVEAPPTALPAGPPVPIELGRPVVGLGVVGPLPPVQDDRAAVEQLLAEVAQQPVAPPRNLAVGHVTASAPQCFGAGRVVQSPAQVLELYQAWLQSLAQSALDTHPRRT
jgi:hypothetical protein